MKIFVATSEGQGLRQNDFCDAKEGELLTFAVECSRDEENPNGNCGCRRSLLGMESGGATTTFTIAELKLSPAQYEEKVVEYFASRGWFAPDNFDSAKMFRRDAAAICEEAAPLPVGVVLEKRGDRIQIRQPVRSTTAFVIARHRFSADSASLRKNSS